MSDKYRKSMDRISVSDELKARILTEADKKINSKKTRRLPVFYIRCAAACAMCAALCITVFNIADRRSQMGIVPTQTLSPSAEIENDVDKIRDEVGYEFKVPSYLPEGYELSEASLLFGTLIQLRYESDENSILFRTEKTAEDISGDYSIYETVEKESIKGNDVTLRANGEIYYSAVWISDDAYSLYAPCGLAKEELVKIIENIK